MPLAEAKLLAMEAPRSREGYLGCFRRVGLGGGLFSLSEDGCDELVTWSGA